MLKAVLDTNQFVSSLITKKGISARLVQAWRDSAYILITSREILEELRRVLEYPHIMDKYHLTDDDINALFTLIHHEAVVLTEVPELDIIKDDPEDNKILACAVKARAQYIVSGDQHLLALAEYKKTSIVTAREFLGIIEYAA
jgi:putative PIN family toxin of toxin-antitoxin system